MFATTMRHGRFHGRSEGARLLAERALAYLPEAAGQSILDLGCGTGDLAVALKRDRPDSRVTGIDFSLANVEAARARTDAILFHFGDYLHWQGGPFAMIVADSVLHLIEGPFDAVASKIAGDLAQNGLLVATVPDNCLQNRLLMLARRLYRLTPPVTDSLVVRLAMLLHPGLSREVLTDRMPYMRNLPRLFGAREQSVFARMGLHLEHAEPLANPSLAKPRHCLMVWRRGPVAV
jgi:trans-aconitate methyltransferase